MKSPARRFTLLMLAMTLIFVGAVALLNWRVDPYERFGNNHLGIYVTADREVKAAEVTRYPHNALYVGNSRMHVIQASQLKGFQFFNGGFAAATLEEMYWYIHRYAHGLELVVIGIDLGVDNPAQGDTAALRGDIFGGRSWASNADHLVNLQTTILSFKTIYRHRAKSPATTFQTARPGRRIGGMPRGRITRLRGNRVWNCTSMSSPVLLPIRHPG